MGANRSHAASYFYDFAGKALSELRGYGKPEDIVYGKARPKQENAADGQVREITMNNLIDQINQTNQVNQAEQDPEAHFREGMVKDIGTKYRRTQPQQPKNDFINKILSVVVGGNPLPLGGGRSPVNP